MGSINGINGSRLNPLRRSSTWSGKPPLSALYDLLIAPMEESFLPPSNSGSAELVIVLQVCFVYCSVRNAP